MEEKGAGQFQQKASTDDSRRNIVELGVVESRRQLRLKIRELLRLANSMYVTTSEMQHQLLLGVQLFGNQFALQLVRSLNNNDQHERQSIIWFLTLLNDKETIQPLQHLSSNEQLTRPVRLSASLALAGMGVTTEMIEYRKQAQLYALG